MHAPDHVKWYFQCIHRCIGRPILVKAWSTSNPVVRTSNQERYNNEDNHTPCFKVPTRHKWVHVHDGNSVDLSWRYVTLCATLMHRHTLYWDMQANERKKITYVANECLQCKTPPMHEQWDRAVRVEEVWSVCEIDLECIQMSDEEPWVFENFPNQEWNQP